MKVLMSVAVLFGLVYLSSAKSSPPNVQVYSRKPGHFGKENTLICHLTGFYPPEISVKLLHNGQEMNGANQTDLSFEENWHYHTTKCVHFHPKPEDKFVCRVMHMGRSTDYAWVSDV